MTNLVDQSISPRGRRRREQLVEAGVELLAEGGWPAVTTRAVAERAEANVGLIHYHFGGLLNLKAVIARSAGAQVFDPVTEQLTSASTADEARLRLLELLAAPLDSREARLTVEIIAGAAREPVLGEVLREGLSETRAQLRAWIRELRPGTPEGTETVLIALLDGMLLHRMLDPGLDPTEAVGALAHFLSERAGPDGGTGPNPPT